MRAMYQVAIDTSLPVFGPDYDTLGGCIAVAGYSLFRHRFGGESWLVADSESQDAKPSIILTLDLSDPLLSDLQSLSLDELPLCSHIAYDIGASSQLFEIDPNKRSVTCVQRGAFKSERTNLPAFSLNEKPLTLLPMNNEDLPTSEVAYWSASDLFVGGGRFIRILGPPLWLYAVEVVKCSCGRSMRYVGAIGYESRPPFSQLIDNGPVFFGEMGLYWFLCERCLTFAVTSQST